MKRKKNHVVIQALHFMLELLFQVYCSYTVFLEFFTCEKQIGLEKQHFYLNFLSLIFVPRKICMTHSFCCFPYSWILFSWLHFHNNCSIWFFISFSVKDLLLFIINSFSYLKLSSIFFGHSKRFAISDHKFWMLLLCWSKRSFSVFYFFFIVFLR